MEELNKSDRDRFVKENAAWGRLTPAERVAWTQALSQYPPTTLNTIANFALDACLKGNIPVLFPQWVTVALYWDSLGFTPEHWLEFYRRKNESPAVGGQAYPDRFTEGDNL